MRDAEQTETEGQLVWAWLNSGRAYLMVSRSQEPMTPGVRDVILYLYASDLVAYRNHLVAGGIEVGSIEYPTYMPKGEFGIEDPDRYCVLVGQTGEASL